MDLLLNLQVEDEVAAPGWSIYTFRTTTWAKSNCIFVFPTIFEASFSQNNWLNCDVYLTTSHFSNEQLKQKTLELQISALKIKQHEEKLIHEQSQMKIYADQVSQLLSTEKNLRLQLTADGEKFQQFQVSSLPLLHFLNKYLSSSRFNMITDGKIAWFGCDAILF